MPKIALIGAGSFGFTRTLVRDILAFPLLRDSTIALMDIDSERLSYIKRACERIVREGNYPAKVLATTNRAEALRGADAVICTILVGGVQVWRHDVEIPKKYGVDMNVGDTRSVSGVFRALRTIPVMLDICRDMERYCPQAVLLNYTNPMAMLCRAMQRQTGVKLVGLCHSVQGIINKLARWIGAPRDEITYLCAGINHQAWVLKFEWKGVDAYPLIREAIQRPEVANNEPVRNEMFRQLGYYVTESSGHNSEYNWWFRKRPDLIARYCNNGTAFNPGVYGFCLDEYLQQEETWRSEIQKWLDDPSPLDLAPGNEYAACIINALIGGETHRFNGNVRNTGLISNLPQDACVEVPVYADRNGLSAVHVGALPVQCAALNAANVTVEEMAVEACLTGDPEMVFYACAYDPLCAAVLSLEEIRTMVNEMLEQNRKHLPTFRRFRA